MASPNIAVVGCGYWGRNIIRSMAELKALAAVCDVSPEAATKLAAEHGVKALRVEEALAAPGVEGIAIATPAETHKELALAAFAAGKHVFVEKPLALSIADGETLRAAAKKAGCILMVGHLLQYHPAFVTLLALVREGRLGEIRYAYSNRLSLGKVRTEEDALWSFAPHDISMLLALFGDRRPKTVERSGGAWLTEGVEDMTRLTLEFEGGGQAQVFVSWLHPFKEHRLVVVGSRAMAVFEDSASGGEKLRLYDHSVAMAGKTPEVKKAEPIHVEYPAGEPLKAECSHFLASIAGKAAPRTDADEALRVLEVLERASRR